MALQFLYVVASVEPKACAARNLTIGSEACRAAVKRGIASFALHAINLPNAPAELALTSGSWFRQ